ncbi:MAG TPA: hypothetical protein VHA82_12395 [Ramlibacter sp.]|uniref:hypothetical protein n=1 Tax=Ramlibacter sp. TaxID=1917967 RepID=UPI002B5C6EAC|nr:hypothetical protein [Ramlibacter sp.]HVZ44601.1 hypothetical protein [Ramlibacter sp.]
MSIAFRHTAGFGKRIEYYIVGLMLKQGLDVYMPLVDDNAIDAVIKRPDGTFIEVQIKARSNDVGLGHGGLFAAITHELRHNYWFVLYTERHDGIFILSSDEFIEEAVQNKTGINAGKRSLWLNGMRKNKETGEREEYIKDKYQKYLCRDFSRLLSPPPKRKATRPVARPKASTAGRVRRAA